MKIILIMGNHEVQGFPPLGVLYLAGYLQKHNPSVSVKVYDVFPTIHELLRQNATLIGFSAMTYQYPSVSEYARALQKEYRGLILLGGVHISLTKDLPDWADIGIIGEGEQTLSELTEMLCRGKKNFGIIPGLLYREGDTIRQTVTRQFISCLDDIPIPARQSIDMDPYLKKNNVYGTVIEKGLSILTSRGCTYHCQFCSAAQMWRKTRFHSAEYISHEIEHLVKTYQIAHLWVVDDHFGQNVKRLQQLVDVFERKRIYVGLGVNCRIESYTPQTAELFHRIGVRAIAFGFETGSERMLHRIKSNMKLSVRKGIEIARQANNDGFEIHGMFMINLPGETKEELVQTLDMIKELPLAKCSVAIATPYLGTTWWEIAAAQGIVPSEPDDEYWRSYNMKKLDINRPTFRNEVGKQELMEIYNGIIEYQKKLFYFDWKNDKEGLQ